MPTIIDLLSHPAGCVVLHGASGAPIYVDYRSHVGTPTRLSDVLIAWDLLGDDEEHTPIPPTAEGIALLGDKVEAYVLAAIIEHSRAQRTARKEGGRS